MSTMRIAFTLQPETASALAKVPPDSVSARSVSLGVREGEPLLVVADALLSYAKAYKARFGCTISTDGVGAEAFADMVRGVRAFLDHDGGVALRRGITTDSKDNGAMFEIVEAICAAAGIDYQEL